MQEDFELALIRYQAILDEFPNDTVSRVLARQLEAMASRHEISAAAAE
jgi:hypothetical protein